MLDKTRNVDQIPVPKFSVSVMVWAALSEKGVYLTIAEAKSTDIDSRAYCLVLQDFLLHANALFPEVAFSNKKVLERIHQISRKNGVRTK